MSDDKLDAIMERLDVLSYDFAELEKRIDGLENEMRVSIHEQAPQVSDMRRELVDLKRAVEDMADGGDGGKPIEATQPPPRR